MSSRRSAVADPGSLLPHLVLAAGVAVVSTASILIRYALDEGAGSAAIAKIENQPVAVVDAGDGSARFVVFNAAALGVVVPPGEWRSGDVGGGRAGALRVEDGMCFLVLVKGSAADASDYARRMAP